MAVRAKFYVQSVKHYAYDVNAIEVELNAVTRKTDDNAAWCKATPSGTLKMNVTAQPAADIFKALLGKDVWIDFAPVEE